MNRQLSFLDILQILDTALQFADYDMTTKEVGNNAIMQALQEQNERYFKTIIENQNRILSYLSDKDMSA